MACCMPTADYDSSTPSPQSLFRSSPWRNQILWAAVNKMNSKRRVLVLLGAMSRGQWQFEDALTRVLNPFHSTVFGRTMGAGRRTDSDLNGESEKKEGIGCIRTLEGWRMSP